MARRAREARSKSCSIRVPEQETTWAQTVSWEKSSRVTKVPLAESRRLFVTESVVVGHQEEGQEEKGEKQGEVEGEGEKLKDHYTSWMVWRWGE